MVLCSEQKQKEKKPFFGSDPCNSAIVVYVGGRKTSSARTKMGFSHVFRKQKVLNIRRRLRDGTYDLDKYLDASLDKIFNELRS